MGVCVFKTSDIKRCIKHALSSTKWDMGWSELPSQPAILFVHDHGVYCMSNGSPRDMESEQTCYVAYAKGCNPKVDEDFHEEARHLVGGDDFGETIPVNAETLKRCDQYEEMRIRVNSKSMSITFNKPKKS
jgi:hypothetical protein